MQDSEARRGKIWGASGGRERNRNDSPDLSARFGSGKKNVVAIPDIVLAARGWLGGGAFENLTPRCRGARTGSQARKP